MNQTTDYKTVVLVGQPNSGKDTLFNVMSDIKSSSVPGTSELIKESLVNIGGFTCRLIDLPSTYSLNPTVKNEEETINFLLNNQIDLIINVVDSSILTRSLELTVELTELGNKMVVALNMYDEAQSHGLDINSEKLSNILNIPVVPTMAVYGKGIKQLVDASASILYGNEKLPAIFKFTEHIELSIKTISEKLNDRLNGYFGNTRFYAIKSIENNKLIKFALSDETKSLINTISEELEEAHKLDGFETISYERHHIAMKLSEIITQYRETRSRKFVDKIDDYLLHPIGGYFFLGLFLFLYFFLIFIFGDLISQVMNIPLEALAGTFEPLRTSNPFLWHSINGAYQGVTGIFGIVLPYFLPLIFLTFIYEDTGYISRIAFLIDGLFHKIGLHGKSVVPFIIGFGCSVPAIYATRMIESKRDRMITGILIPFIPCSARIAVIFALAAAFTGPLWAIIVFAFVLFIISASGKVLSMFLSKPLGMILEIPSLKVPSLKLSTRKTWQKTREFMKEAMIFLLAGSIILSWIEYFNVSSYVNYVFAPLLENILGLPEQLGSTLVFGFLRKELIIVMAGQALGVGSIEALPLTVNQVIVFVIFTTLYFPCLTTFVVMWKEFGAKTGIYSAIFSVVIATISALAFKIVLNL